MDFDDLFERLYPSLYRYLHRLTGDADVAETQDAEAERRGGFRLEAPLWPGGVDPRFLRGSGGIGYVLLRLARPEALPAVLSWNPPAAALAGARRNHLVRT